MATAAATPDFTAWELPGDIHAVRKAKHERDAINPCSKASRAAWSVKHAELHEIINSAPVTTNPP